MKFLKKIKRRDDRRSFKTTLAANAIVWAALSFVGNAGSIAATETLATETLATETLATDRTDFIGLSGTTDPIESIGITESTETVVPSESAAEIVFETNDAILRLDELGKVRALIDKRTGLDYQRKNFDDYFCSLRTAKDASPIFPLSLRQEGSTLVVGFENDLEATLNVETNPEWLTFEVLDVKSPAPNRFYSLEFARVFAEIDYNAPDSFGLSPLILSIQTNLPVMPGRAKRSAGICFNEIGCRGAKIAMIAAPERSVRPIMKKVYENLLDEMERDPELQKTKPVMSKAGGPFALDIEKCRGSYIITSTPIQAKDVPEWAEFLLPFGVDQVDFHQGEPYRQGDFVFDPVAYPDGIADFRKTADSLKSRGMIAGLHTYSMFLDFRSRFVAPVPSPDLDVLENLTLAAPLDDDATSFPVEESTENVSTVTGFFVWNSRYLKIDDEIIRFDEVVKNAPGDASNGDSAVVPGDDSSAPPFAFGFARLERGALGTRASAHSKGARVERLSSLFGDLFVPRPGSPLFYEIARETAKTYDDGGFGMIYLDALDGNSRPVPNKDLVWFFDALFVREILENIKSDPPLLEYSTMHPSLWAARSRMGAWDSPSKGYIPFFNLHFNSNRETATNAYLPGQIGWLSLCPSASGSPGDYQERVLHREVVEYLGTKAIAYDYGLSYNDLYKESLPPGGRLNGELLNRFDRLRRTRAFSPEERETLKDPNRFFALVADSNGCDRLVPADYPSFKINERKTTISLNNPFLEQIPGLRVENHCSTAAYDDAAAQEIVPFDESQAPKSDLETTFDPPLNLNDKLGLGIWIFGDGKGQIVNVRVSSPEYRTSGFTDHYYKVDHCGWRYVSWAEAENGAIPDVRWPAPSDLYSEFREAVHYDEVSGVRVMIQGDPTGLRFRSLRALPLASNVLTNPKIKTDRGEFGFEGTIANGEYLEYDGGETATVRNCRGEVVRSATLRGEPFVLPSGNSTLEIEFEADESLAPSTTWTWFLRDRSEQPVR